MIYDLRSYTFKPSNLSPYLEVFTERGWPRIREFSTLVGHFTADTGSLSRLVHIWRYESRQQRRERRAALYSDPGWRAFIPHGLPLIETQANVLLSPTAFSPDPLDKTTLAGGLYELRCYTLERGVTSAFLDAFERDALPVANRHLDLAAYWQTQSGLLGNVMHLWRYEDEGDRDERQAALAADPDWATGFLQHCAPLIQSASSDMLHPTGLLT